MKIVNIDRENLHILRTKRSDLRYLKSQKSSASPPLQMLHFWKDHRGGQIDPAAFFRVKH